MREYDFKNIEGKWRKYWDAYEIFEPTRRTERPKYYCLVMFPYPSGDLHIGHGRNYILGDCLMRWKTKEGYRVLFPIGWDAFGLPAENAAIERNINPRQWTEANIDRMRQQLKAWGIGFDWKREIKTCDPDYYQWTQMLFVWMYERGLAYRKMATVNWCPKCATVLANEQVVGGCCERCDTPVTTKRLEQWFFKITAYAEELLNDIDRLEDWPERVKTMQRNWIGRSEGVDIFFKLDDGRTLPCFTTRVDTLFGATYAVISADHPELEDILKGSPLKAQALEFANKISARTIQRKPDETEKEGIFTGKYLINPINDEKIPLWIADYVVGEYGTGAIMAVPAHDQRDFEFAKKYGLPIRIVISPDGKLREGSHLERAYEGDGFQVNSGDFDGLPNREAMERIADYLEAKGLGKRTIRYRLRDWLISRQRYWGTPIPIVYCEKCGALAVEKDSLPVILPDVEKFKPTGESPLVYMKEFVETTCPRCRGSARRETDTMDTFVDSTWYYLRYLNPHDSEKPFGREEVREWLPVDMYIGGIEHAIAHLLYARFVGKVLADMDLIPYREPLPVLFTQGMICKDGAKMSKSKGNVVSADDLIANFGTDTVRISTLFMGPPEKDVEWVNRGIEGAYRFLNRIWRMVERIASVKSTSHIVPEDLNDDEMALLRKTHWMIKKVKEDVAKRFHFNTAISAIMELVNEMYRVWPEVTNPPRPQTLGVLRDAAEKAIHMLAPMAPHICEEMWQALGHKESVFLSSFPDWDEDMLQAATLNIVVQINGKVRATIVVPADSDQEEIAHLAKQDPAVKKWLEGKAIKKSFYVKDKLISFVVS